MMPVEPSCGTAPPEVNLRDARLDDAAAIAEIYNESIQAGNATMDNVAKTAADIERQLKNFTPREVIMVLVRGTSILGWGIIKRYSDRVGYRVCCETSVYLRHGELRQGFGSLIKRAIINRCRQMGYHHLVAKIFSENIASIEYNKKIGYEVVGVQREIGFRNGKWRDVVIMQLILDDVPPYQPELS